MLSPVIHTVLLVDSDADTRHICRTILEYFSYQVFEAEIAVVGLRLAHEVRPQLIIREYPIRLPDGSTLADTLKRDPDTAHIRFLTLTARVTGPELEAARGDHSDLVLTKPIDPRQLVVHVQSLIGGPQ